MNYEVLVGNGRLGIAKKQKGKGVVVGSNRFPDVFLSCRGLVEIRRAGASPVCSCIRKMKEANRLTYHTDVFLIQISALRQRAQTEISPREGNDLPCYI